MLGGGGGAGALEGESKKARQAAWQSAAVGALPLLLLGSGVASMTSAP